MSYIGTLNHHASLRANLKGMKRSCQPRATTRPRSPGHERAGHMHRVCASPQPSATTRYSPPSKHYAPISSSSLAMQSINRFLYGPTPEEKVRAWQGKLRAEQRVIEREMRQVR